MGHKERNELPMQGEREADVVWFEDKPDYTDTPEHVTWRCRVCGRENQVPCRRECRVCSSSEGVHD